MSLTGMVNTARSLGFFERWQQVTANNLANADTPAFKADRVTAALPRGDRAPVPVGHLDLRPAPLRDTGRPLDVALDGPGFMVVAGAEGERLVRGGSLRLDAGGQLVDAHGDPVLGANGPLVLRGGEIEIGAAGDVLVDGAVVDRLRLVEAPAASALRKEGRGRYATDAPLAPLAEGVTKVTQGALEDPNVDPILGMVEMIAIQRTYAINIEALRAMDGVMGTVTGDVGKV